MTYQLKAKMMKRNTNANTPKVQTERRLLNRDEPQTTRMFEK